MKFGALGGGSSCKVANLWVIVIRGTTWGQVSKHTPQDKFVFRLLGLGFSSVLSCCKVSKEMSF
jgi:hypothetical protein